MYSLHWTEPAEEDLLRIVAYIAERNVGAAQRLESAIVATAQRLLNFPLLYRKGRKPGTREAVVTPNYILVYRVVDEQITVLNVLHARQNYP